MFKVLDLFSGAGGAAMGLHRAWEDAEIVGVDIHPQPRYPFTFVQGDATRPPFDLTQFDFIWASPPCQHYSTMTRGRWKDREHPALIKPIRNLLVESGRAYVIENVGGARAELINPIMLCGTMLGLETKQGSQLRRHRYFELSNPFFLVPPCSHNKGSAIGVYGGGQHPGRRRPATIGVWGHAGGSSKRDNLQQFGTQDRRDAMGIDWMTGSELSESIPPAYSEYIARQIRPAR